ncbi:O-antigen ligase family protein [Patescibacteria group bacterium]|nr:O-antigen ligase family protein [Patescibacteria group bacterium]
MKLSLRFLITALLFYGSLLFAPHKVVMFFLCLVYFFVLWKMVRDFKQAMMVIYLTMTPVIVGKLFAIDLVSAQELAIAGRDFGIAADIMITVSDFIVGCMGIVLIAERVRGTLVYRKLPALEAALFLYAAGSIVATMFGSVQPEISFFHALFALRPMIIYYFFASPRSIPLATAISVAAAWLFFETFMVVAQMLRGGSLGLVIEPIANYVSVDLSLEAGRLLRYGGTYMHANALAHALLVPVCMVLPVVFYPFEKKGTWFAAGLFLGLLTLVLTMSRSSWLSLGVALILCYYLAKRLWGYVFVLRVKLSVMQRAIVAVALVILVMLMMPRLISTTSTGGLYGSWETRALLIEEYWRSFRMYPYFGVGLEMDVYYQYLQSLIYGDRDIDAPNRAVVLYFPEPVHNGFLRLMMQTGVVGAIPYIAVYGLLFGLVWKSMKQASTEPHRLLTVSFIGMFVAAGVNGFLQPILPDLPLFTALTMLYLPHKI